MSTNSLMNMGVQAMFAAQTQLNTTGHNIVNAGVAGYSRQTVKLATVAGRESGVGYLGAGVAVDTVERAVSRFLTAQNNQSQAQAAADSTRRDLLGQLESGFPLGELGLGQAASRMFNAFGEVAASPTDVAVREVALSAVETTASRLRTAGEHLASLQSATSSQLADEATQVNGLTEQVADLNRQLLGTGQAKHQPNDLLDRRDALIAQISTHIEVSRVDNRDRDGKPDGTVSLFVAGGQPLVLGANSHALRTVPDAGGQDRVRLAIEQHGQVRELSGTALGGGAMAGLLRFQDEDLGQVSTDLGQMAAALADALNTRHASGTDLDGVAGRTLLQVGEPVAMAAAGNARDAQGGYAAQVTLRRVAGQGAQLKASDYTLQQDPSDSSRYQLTRASDGTVFGGLANGAQVDGFSFEVGSTPLAAQDRFLLQPVSTATTGVAVAITDPRKFAAAGSGAAGSGNANALAMQDLVRATAVEGKRFTDAHARLVSSLGSRVQRVTSEADTSTEAAALSKTQLGSQTGVNLEEEAARLLEYQQSYQAATKVLVTAQKLFDTMLSIVG
jgi:flagellar hook-associated protein 1 FlgK